MAWRDLEDDVNIDMDHEEDEEEDDEEERGFDQKNQWRRNPASYVVYGFPSNNDNYSINKWIWSVPGKRYYYPILITSIVIGIFSAFIYVLYSINYSLEPSVEEFDLGSSDVFPFLIILSLSFVGWYLLYRYARNKGMAFAAKVSTGLIIFFTVFQTIILGNIFIYDFGGNPDAIYLVYLIATIEATLLAIVCFRPHVSYGWKNVALLLISCEFGFMLSFFIGKWVVTTLICFDLVLMGIQMLRIDSEMKLVMNSSENAKKISREEFANMAVDVSYLFLLATSLLISNAILSTGSIIVTGATLTGILFGWRHDVSIIRRKRRNGKILYSLFLGLGFYWISYVFVTYIFYF